MSKIKSIQYFMFIFLVLIFSSCSDTLTSSNNSSNQQEATGLSFLNGGTFGTISYKVVDFDNITTLPYLGGYTYSGNDYNQSLPFFTYGGTQSTLGNSYELYGNSTTNAPVKLRYLLVPNLNITQLYKPLSFGLQVAANYASESLNGCVQQNTNNELLYNVTGSSIGLINLSTNPCLQMPLMQNIVLTAPNQAIQIDINLGTFSQTMMYVFRLMQLSPSNSYITNSMGQTAFWLSNTLNINSTLKNTLPSNTIAHGDFLPNPDGFGVTNFGSVDSNTLNANDAAEMFGADMVCYNKDVNNCALNAYGYYQKWNLTDMASGECYGYAMASMMLKQRIEFKGKSKPSDYNKNATSAILLNKSDVAKLIAYKFNNQSTPEYLSYKENICFTSMTVQNVINTITKGFANGDPISNLEIRSQNAGHSITPYAISKITDDNYRIYVYDNNFPGNSQRYIDANISTNTFFYNGSVNANSTTDVYSQQYAPMCPIPVSMQKYYKIESQQVNSVEFRTNIETLFMITNDKNQTTGYNFANLPTTTLKNIPNSKITFLSSNPIIKIPNVNNSNALGIITSPSELQQYLSQAYEIEALANNYNYNIFSGSTVSEKFSNGIHFMQSFSKNATSTIYYHPSSRIIVAKNPSILNLTLYMDDNINKKGYIYQINTSYLLNNPNLNLGTLITDNGALEVFVYDSSTLKILTENINYTISLSLIDSNGQFTSNTASLTQPINSAVQISAITTNQASVDNLKTSLASNNNRQGKQVISLSINRVF